MTRAHATAHAAQTLATHHHTTIGWEAMPSLAQRMVPMGQHLTPAKPAPRSAASDFNSAWGITMPADFDTSPQAAPFHEAIRGLVTREVNEPDLFKHFFG